MLACKRSKNDVKHLLRKIILEMCGTATLVYIICDTNIARKLPRAKNVKLIKARTE